MLARYTDNLTESIGRSLQMWHSRLTWEGHSIAFFAVLEVKAFPSYLKDQPGSDLTMIFAVSKPNKSHDITLRVTSSELPNVPYLTHAISQCLLLTMSS